MDRRTLVAAGSITAVLLLAAGLAGIRSVGGSLNPSTGAGGWETGTASPEGYRYTCPPMESDRRSDGLCVGSISQINESYQEPFIAFDPDRPWSVAIGVNRRLLPGNSQLEPYAGVEEIRMDLFVSDDGGETWTLRETPFEPTEPGEALFGGSFDPAMAWDGSGTLHVTAIGSDWNLYYTSTSDMGRTWTEPVVIRDDADRNWIEIGPEGRIHVTWQGDGAAQAAVRDAHGGEWTRFDPVQDCSQTSPVAFPDGTPLFACAHLNDDFEATRVEVHRLDPASGTRERLSAIEQLEAEWPQLRAASDGSLILTARDWDAEPGPMVAARSTDGGRTWTSVDLWNRITIEDDWEDVFYHWSTVDPWGNVHFIVGDGVGGDRDRLPEDHVEEPREVGHVALTPDLRTVLSERALTSDEPVEEKRVPPPLAPLSADDYSGADFTSEAGLLVWARDRGLDVTEVEPVLGTGP